MKLALSISTAAMCHFEAKPRNLSSGRSLTEFYLSLSEGFEMTACDSCERHVGGT